MQKLIFLQIWNFFLWLKFQAFKTFSLSKWWIWFSKNLFEGSRFILRGSHSMILSWYFVSGLKSALQKSDNHKNLEFSQKPSKHMIFNKFKVFITRSNFISTQSINFSAHLFCVSAILMGLENEKFQKEKKNPKFDSQHLHIYFFALKLNRND